MITGTMRPADGAELQFVVQEYADGKVGVILYVGGRRAARLDDKEQREFLQHFHAAQEAAEEVKSQLRGSRGY